MSDEISYDQEPALPVDDFIGVLQRSGLAERRPVDDRERLQRMIDGADLILTARNAAGLLIGVSRAVTDFSYCCYLSDLAVDRNYQGHGIGRTLIQRTRAASGPQALLILLSAPGARTYYPHVGLDRHDAAFTLPRLL